MTESTPSPSSLVVGATRLTLVPDGDRLTPSGEGVYGVRAAEGWGSYTPPDESGGIALMPHSLLVQGPGGTTLVDTGGEAPDEVPGRRSDFIGQLRSLGLAPEDVRNVVLTHAHLDHVGYNTLREGDAWKPTFPNATYWIQKAEAEGVRQSDPARWERYFGPIERAGLLELVEGDGEVSSGLSCLATPGHTAGHQSVTVDCGSGRIAIYVGDLAVTKLHIEHPDWHPAWCASPEDELRSKDRLVRLALERDALLVFGHDPHVQWGRIRTSAREGRVEVVPV